jgi:hypothetical protein
LWQSAVVNSELSTKQFLEAQQRRGHSRAPARGVRKSDIDRRQSLEHRRQDAIGRAIAARLRVAFEKATSTAGKA